MAFIPCSQGGGKTIHTDTYNYSVGSSATQTQDLGEEHTYRYVKYPYTKCVVTLKVVLTVNQNSVGTTVGTRSGTYYTTVTVNTVAKTYSLGGSTSGSQGTPGYASAAMGTKVDATSSFAISVYSVSWT